MRSKLFSSTLVTSAISAAASSGGVRRASVMLVALGVGLAVSGVRAETLPARGVVDSRVRVAAYNVDEVYVLHGYVGYQIDLEFEPGESFVGLGAGDLGALAFVAQDNHLFLKPKSSRVDTNLTVLTNRRHYHFAYVASAEPPDSAEHEVIYALRFTYPPPIPTPKAAGEPNRVDERLATASAERAPNLDYWYCGHPSLKPTLVSDDGVHTRLRFNARSELPAIFVRNDDGAESLVNFSIEAGDVIVHRVARRFIVRRGRLTGCIVNKGFEGGGVRLDSGTVSPDVERTTRGERP